MVNSAIRFVAKILFIVVTVLSIPGALVGMAVFGYLWETLDPESRKDLRDSFFDKLEEYRG